MPIECIHIFENLDRCGARYYPADGLSINWYRLTDWTAIEPEYEWWAVDALGWLAAQLPEEELARFHESLRRPRHFYNDPLS